MQQLEKIFAKLAKREELNPFCEGLSLYLKEIMQNRPRPAYLVTIIQAQVGEEPLRMKVGVVRGVLRTSTPFE